jgi:hypothetical protein
VCAKRSIEPFNRSKSIRFSPGDPCLGSLWSRVRVGWAMHTTSKGTRAWQWGPRVSEREPALGGARPIQHGTIKHNNNQQQDNREERDSTMMMMIQFNRIDRRVDGAGTSREPPLNWKGVQTCVCVCMLAGCGSRGGGGGVFGLLRRRAPTSHHLDRQTYDPAILPPNHAHTGQHTRSQPAASAAASVAGGGGGGGGGGGEGK